MEFHTINIIYAALLIREHTEKTTFSCKDDWCKDLLDIGKESSQDPVGIFEVVTLQSVN